MLAVARPHAVGLTGFASNRSQVAGGGRIAHPNSARTATIGYPKRRRTRTAQLAGWPDHTDDRHRAGEPQNLAYNICRLVTLVRLAAA
jgi:hypothetical protein